ncbi:MAG: hypothetical protein DCC71_06530 [Proteobacteria bacterium]|nr:MAG: hypothetical protein DCC71_06530 [Pseudomonadota bacterium]
MPRWLGRVALVCAGLIGGLAGGEVLARLFAPAFQIVFRETITASDDPALGYALRPGALDGRDRISAEGLRDREYARPKPPGTFRIAAIGDSITYGSGVRRAGSWSEQLEALLDERGEAGGVAVEIVNLGVPGYNIEQVVARLRGSGLAFEPDAVVYGYALNDPQAFSIEAAALSTLRAAYDRQASGLARRWLAHSRLYLLGRHVAFERSKQAVLRSEPPRDPAYEEAGRGDPVAYFRSIHSGGEGAARLARGLDALAEVARARDLPVLVVLFPLFSDGDADWGAALADVHALVARGARERGFAVLDLLPVYEAAVPAAGAGIGVDFMHPNRVGHRIAALALLDWMCAKRWLPAAATDCARPAQNAGDAQLARLVHRVLAAAPD